MAIGDIGVVVDTLEFDTSQGVRPNIIQIASGVYAIVYEGVDNDGRLKTVAINALGNIGIIIDSFEFAPDIGTYYPKIVHVSGDIYAIAYNDTTNDEGRIVTVEIDSDGNITEPVIDGPNAFATANIDTSQNMDFIKVASGMYAAVYSNGFYGLYMSSIGISDAGTIDAAVTDTLGIITGNILCTDPSMIKAGGDIVAITYRESLPVYGLMLVTVEVTDAGAISDAVIDSFEIAGYGLITPKSKIIHVSGDYYAIAYNDTNADGILVTITIDSAGDIGAALTDSFEFEPVTANRINVIQVLEEVFALAWRDTDRKLQLATIDIDASGNIGASLIDQYEFKSTTVWPYGFPKIIMVSTDDDGVFGIVYTDAAGDGQLVTIGVPFKFYSQAQIIS